MPVRRLQADIDTDFVLTTSGAGAQYLSRTFVTPAGVTSVSLRYMFVTREFPKYYASQCNDAFSVTITSASAKGVVAIAASTLNAFAYNEYTITDLGGATSWFQLTAPVSSGGDTVGIRVSVSNVGDGVVDSMIIVDKVITTSLSITDIALADIDGDPLRFLSASPHPYFDGNTRVHGTLSVHGAVDDNLADLQLEVLQGSVVVVVVKPPAGLQASLFKPFGSAGLVAVTDGRLRLRIRATTGKGAQAVADCGSVIKLVLFTGSNRFGSNRYPEFGGDAWAVPQVVKLAKAVGDSFQWNDFSNMNGGFFVDDKGHSEGLSLDGLFAGYTSRSAAVAQQMINQINSLPNMIRMVYVTFTSAYQGAIAGKTLDDGRRVTDVIIDTPGHSDHFHWEINAPAVAAVSLPPATPCPICQGFNALGGACEIVRDGTEG
ncbi:hypothetical protein OEZ86_013654 [Tetradesmus obliquus]|nr:hypothetical protein OEZ86_013654 [Tetradesmus obliquus]